MPRVAAVLVQMGRCGGVRPYGQAVLSSSLPFGEGVIQSGPLMSRGGQVFRLRGHSEHSAFPPTAAELVCPCNSGIWNVRRPLRRRNRCRLISAWRCTAFPILPLRGGTLLWMSHEDRVITEKRGGSYTPSIIAADRGWKERGERIAPASSVEAAGAVAGKQAVSYVPCILVELSLPERSHAPEHLQSPNRAARSERG